MSSTKFNWQNLLLWLKMLLIELQEAPLLLLNAVVRNYWKCSLQLLILRASQLADEQHARVVVAPSGDYIWCVTFHIEWIDSLLAYLTDKASIDNDNLIDTTFKSTLLPTDTFCITSWHCLCLLLNIQCQLKWSSLICVSWSGFVEETNRLLYLHCNTTSANSISHLGITDIFRI